ncbi:MAG: ABC transporter permease [Firmicutes bacterium]|nr:ABC transporter permease [Bacillota bacterium]
MSINPAEAVALPELRRRLGRWGENWRTFRMAAWLGWQIESNWTDPFLFLIYSVVKPLSQSLILIVMYFVVNGGGTGEGLFPFIFVGNTFFMYVMAILFGLSFVVIEDREYYQMIKYIYTSTAHIFWYLFGRAVTKFALTTVSVLILLLFGTLILGVPISLARVDHPLFFIVLTMGVISSAALGICVWSDAGHGPPRRDGLGEPGRPLLLPIGSGLSPGGLARVAATSGPAHAL